MKYSSQRALLAPIFIDVSDGFFVHSSIEDSNEQWLATPQELRQQRQRAKLRQLSVLVVLLVLWFFAESVWAGEEPSMIEGQAPYRSLWLKTTEGIDVSNTLSLSTDISMRISGPILRATVKQRFRNPTQSWVEGIYSFPLPEQAAVDQLRMHIGDRVIEGQIHEKQKAQKVFDQARKAGKRSTLLKLHRANMFTTAVTNIGPGEEIVVEFSYQQVLDYRTPGYSLRFPMVSTPTYTPPKSQQSIAHVMPVNAYRKQDEVPGNPVSITIDLNAGFPIESVSSNSHRIKSDKLSETQYRIELDGSAEQSNRDFQLRWDLQPSPEPMVRVLREDVKGVSYGLLMVMPPQPQPNTAQKQGRDRELVLVLDVSGSMQGESIRQARSAALQAISQLTINDSFNLIFFNNRSWRLFPAAVPANAKNIRLARSALINLQADGGTEMFPALEMALQAAPRSEGLRQVVFVTDGAVSNEKRLFSLIRSRLGDSRLFTVGIGSAPNSYFMRKAAQAGRGTFTYVSRPNEVDQKMNALMLSLNSPVLTDLKLSMTAANLDILPAPLPDVYLGEPVYAYFKADRFPRQAELRGNLDSVPSWLSLPLDEPQQFDGVAVAWARAKIAALLDEYHHMSNQSNELAAQESLRDEITSIALAHHQVSQFTSLVAVDVTPVRTEAPLTQQRVPANLPKGWKGEGIRLAQTATPMMANFYLALLLLVCMLLLRLVCRVGSNSGFRSLLGIQRCAQGPDQVIVEQGIGRHIKSTKP
jgi:Ca-activated chloride channel family protein